MIMLKIVGNSRCLNKQLLQKSSESLGSLNIFRIGVNVKTLYIFHNSNQHIGLSKTRSTDANVSSVVYLPAVGISIASTTATRGS